MTFYEDDVIDIAFVEATNFWVLILNGRAVRDARRENTLRRFVLANSVPGERPAKA